MVDIKLNDGQSGYDVIGDYIRRYWKRNIYDDVIVFMAVSHDGNKYYTCKEVASPENFDDIMYLNDWWEGEKHIKLFGIQSVDELDISGGIYE